MNYLLIFICFCSFFSTIICAKSFINFGTFICPREEKALARCLRDKLNMYIPKLVTGVPEFGVPPCEPLIVPAISIAQAAGPITVTSSYTDVTVRGPSHMRIKDIKIDSASHKIKVNLYIPELKLKGRYSLSGQILLLPITGEGVFTGKYDDIDAVVDITLGRMPRLMGPDALTCEDLEVSFNIGNAAIHLDNLFGGDGEMGKAMNSFLNKNWEKLSEELKGPMEQSLRDFFKPLADHVFQKLNADDILSS